MRKLLKRKVREQNGICAICHHEFIDYNDIVPDHRIRRGWGALGEIIRTIFKQHMGGAMGKKDQPEWMPISRPPVPCELTVTDEESSQ